MNFLYHEMSFSLTIGNISIQHINRIHISESIKKQEDTATIVLPREYTLAERNSSRVSFSGKNIREFIKVGDPVKIDLGYDGKNEKEFSGYVTSISADIPLILKCEDEMYKLRRTNFLKAFSTLSLKQLVNFIAPGYTYDLIDDVNLYEFTIENKSAYQVLERLRKNYGLHSRFVDKILQIGFPISFNPQKVHNIHINKNVRAQSSDLEFIRKEDLRILIRGISLDRDGDKQKYEFGDKSGAVRTLHFINQSRQELIELVKKNYQSLSFAGFRGSIPTWGNVI